MKVLVVEDEKRIAEDVAKTVRASGMAVDVVADGEARGSVVTPKTTTP